MKEKFTEFSAPSETELSDAWKSALFVFDTNVLLDLYRYRKSSQADFLRTFNSLNGRIWIPHHEVS